MLCATLVAVKSNFCSFTLLTSLAKLMGSQWGTYGNCGTLEAMKARKANNSRASFDSTEFPATTRLFVAGDPYSSTDGQLTNRGESFHRALFTSVDQS